MLSVRLVLLAALISPSLARNPSASDIHRRQAADSPPGFTAADFTAEDETVTFRIALAHGNLPGLEKAVYAVSTPGGTQYGQYLTQAQANEYAMPSEDAIKSVTAWLKSQGLAPSPLSPSGDWISVNATIGQANRLFEAEFSKYKAEGAHGPFFRTASYSLPAAVQEHIEAIHPTTAFPVLKLKDQRKQAVRNITSIDTSVNQGSDALFPKAKGPDIPPSCIRSDDPEEWRKPYGLTCRFDLYGIPLASGGNSLPGNSLWVSGYGNEFVNNNMTKDHIASWRPDLVDRGTFGLVTITGGSNPQLPHGWAWVPTGGVSTALSTAVNTPVTFMSVGTENSEDPIVWFIDQANYLLGLENPPQVLVGDWPIEESSVDPALARSLCSSYAQLAARGVTLLFPVSWDGVGPESGQCTEFDVSFPASCPYVTGVGGSSISLDSTREQIDSWNSGGFSNYFQRPIYQDVEVPKYLESLKGVYEGMYNPYGRGTPDVSLHEWMLMTPDSDIAWGYQSYSAFLLGGIVALLNEELLNAGHPALGFLNPFIYQNVDIFNDFTTGNNPGCNTQGFNATTGWDPVSGAGSPAYAKLRKAVGL